MSLSKSNKEHLLEDLFREDIASGKWRCQVKVGSEQCTQLITKHRNTSGRKNHILRKHPEICLKGISQPPSQSDNKQQKIFDAIETNEYPRDSPKNLRLNRLVLDFIIGCNLPLSIVEHPRFLAMVKGFDSKYQQR